MSGTFLVDLSSLNVAEVAVAEVAVAEVAVAEVAKTLAAFSPGAAKVWRLRLQIIVIMGPAKLPANIVLSRSPLSRRLALAFRSR